MKQVLHRLGASDTREAFLNRIALAWALGKRVLSFGYELVCAWKLEAEELLRIGAPGLLPLVPLARGTSLERVEEAFRATSKAKPDVQVALGLLSDWVFPGGDWLAKISEGIRPRRDTYWSPSSARSS